MKTNLLKYEIAKPKICEGDVLLFRGYTWIAFFIRQAGRGIHSHVGIASKHNGNIECVEFREFRGGSTTNLEHQVKANPGLIDVFRPVPSFSSYTFDGAKAIYHKKIFDAKKVTNTMRLMTGLPYGYKLILKLALCRMFGWRLLYNVESTIDDDTKNWIYPVCSTAVAYAFSSNGYDLVKFNSDEYTEPADITRSARLNYLFTLTP